MVERRMEAGCLIIDGITSGRRSSSGLSCPMDLPGVAVRRFAACPPERLWERLQTEWQQLRKCFDTCGIMGLGTGCAGALALAEQLPVDRLVLLEPTLTFRRAPGTGDANAALPDRQARRLMAFAHRNLPLCVSDLLIIETEPKRGGQGDAIARLAVHCRVERLSIRVQRDGKMYTIREIEVKQAISCFLHAGEWQKPLAENPEMCIMDG